MEKGPLPAEVDVDGVVFVNPLVVLVVVDRGGQRRRLDVCQECSSCFLDEGPNTLRARILPRETGRHFVKQGQTAVGLGL